MLQHTTDQGVIDLWEFLAVLECMTDEWYDHSASDNLYVRKMHYAEKRMAGYSFWPGQGWDGLFQDLPTRSSSTAARCSSARRVETGAHRGRRGARASRSRASQGSCPNEFFEGEVLEADW